LGLSAVKLDGKARNQRKPIGVVRNDEGGIVLRSRILLGLFAGIALSALSLGAPAASNAKAIFAGGCFWCEETAFEGVPGVVSVTSGFTGGQKKNPTYEEVSSGSTGHAESVEVIFDPGKISYERLLEIFWHNVDPFDAGGQFCDRGTQYRSAIFYLDDAQRQAALASKAKLEEQPRFKGKIVTQIVAASTFYPAEEYHQDFYKKNPVRYREYRLGCGRDARLKQIWGEAAGGH
jgi:peptide-methionine (S)-S-oxide reductase